jgi:hypothetical protein
MKFITKFVEIMFEYRPTSLDKVCIKTIWSRRFVRGKAGHHYISFLMGEGV